MSDNTFKLLKLDNNNYVIWKWQFQNVLKAKNLASVLEGAPDPATDGQALAILGSALSDENMLKIINCRSFKEAWLALELCFENKTAYEPQALYRRLASYKMHSAKDVSTGISELRGIVAQLKNLNENVSDNCLIGAILSALPESFEVFTTVWKNSADRNVDGLISKLMAEANEQCARESEESKALVSKNKNKFKKNKDDKKVSKDQCRYCKETGHWIKDCPNLKFPYDPDRSKKNNKRKQDDRSFDKPTGEQYDLAFVSTNVPSKLYSPDIWVADSGCTNHMSPFMELFENIEVNIKLGDIHLANESVIRVEGIGNVRTEFGILKDVLFAPQLAQNLFSISAAARNGLTHVGSKIGLTFYYKTRELFVAKPKDNLYLITFNQQVSAKAATLSEWHARFNHINVDTIKRMAQTNAVDDLVIVAQKRDKCTDCALNKCTDASHPSRTTVKATKPGEVLHIDTAGPSNVPSIGLSKYLLLCKDEMSKYRQVAFVQNKSQIANKVKEFISRTKLETKNDVLKIVTDNGSEFVNENLRAYLQERGILHETSSPYVPQQNGFIERDIRTIKEASKTAMSRAKVVKTVWPYAVSCAVHTLNRTCSSNSNKTPYEDWFGRKPSVKHLRVFGQAAILKSKQQPKGSWDERGVEAMFLGYTDKPNTQIFLLNGKVVVACDVVFLDRLYKSSSPKKTANAEELWISGASISTPIIPASDPSVTEPTTTSSTNQDTSNTDNVLTASDELNLMFEGMSVDESVVEVTEQDAAQEQPTTVPPQEPVQQQNVNPPTRDEVQRFIDDHKDKIYKFNRGDAEVRIKVGNMSYDPATKNWRNSTTGHFISNERIRMMMNDAQSRANVARAFIAYDRVPIPSNVAEAINSPYAKQWTDAMSKEKHTLIEHNVYDEIPRTQATKKPIGSRWVFTVKYDKQGNVVEFKARLVAQGFSQVYGIDYNETYCSVVQVMSTRMVLNYAAKKRLRFKQADILRAFLYSDLKEEIYLLPPEGYDNKPNTVWRLKRSLYGLKQSPRMWNERFSSVLTGVGFQKSKYDPSVFFKFNPLVIMIVYVDDAMIFATKDEDIVEVLNNLKKQFKLREVNTNVYRGIEIEQVKDGIVLHQIKYIQNVLKQYNMDNASPADNPICEVEEDSEPLDERVPYRQLVGSLAYIADCTRPDIAIAVNQLARKLSSPTKSDWRKAKHLLRYLIKTMYFVIKYRYKDNIYHSTILVGYSDSDFAGDKSGKSTTGWVILFLNEPFHWKTQIQRHVSLSSTESEVIALCSLAKELSWIRLMMIELRMLESEPAFLLCDNSSALKIVESERPTRRTRHLKAQDAYVREQIENKELVVNHVPASEQLADILTKRVATTKFIKNRNDLLEELECVDTRSLFSSSCITM